MAITNLQTRTKLKQIGCLVDNRVDGRAMSRLFAQRLEAKHMVTKEADLDKLEVTIGQLVSDLIGSPDDEVVEVAKVLLTTNASGQVQRALTNGFVLCGRRIQRHVVVDGEPRTFYTATRFLTSDPAMLRKYVFGVRLMRAESYARNMKALSEVVERRQPGMATDVSDFLQSLNNTMQKQLGVSSTNNKPPTNKQKGSK